MVRTLIGLLPALGCAAVMFLCMRMMGHHGGKDVPRDASDATEVARLREEVAELREQLAARADEEIPAPVSRR